MQAQGSQRISKDDVATNNRAIRVLLIEDDFSYSRLIRAMLQFNDEIETEVDICTNLSDGIDQLNAGEYEAILLDLNLPDTRGLATLRQLLAHQPNANVIVLTGTNDRQQGVQAVGEGAQDYLVKGKEIEEQLPRALRFSIQRKQYLTLQRKTEELQRARDIAEETARVREQVIANVSHELRTPMNAILGMSNLLAETTLDNEQQEFTDSILEASQVLLGIINDILLTSSLQKGTVDLHEEVFELPLTVRRIIEVLKPKALAKQLELHYEVPPNWTGRVVGDKQRLSQVLYNIIGNAVKFTEVGQVEVKVSLSTEAIGDKQQVIIAVADSGPGIPPERQADIFQPFVRVKRAGIRIEGTGLGLNIAQQLVVQMNGDIRLTSTVGEGTTFVITLPFELAKEQAPIAVVKQAPRRRIKSGELNIMVVEDHPMNQLVIRQTLLKQWPELELHIAETGEQAVDFINDHRFDLILMDLQLPGIDGYETTAAIRQSTNPHYHRIPILAMTAQPLVSDDERYLLVGMNDYILKPFVPADLFDKITHYTQNK